MVRIMSVLCILLLNHKAPKLFYGLSYFDIIIESLSDVNNFLPSFFSVF